MTIIQLIHTKSILGPVSTAPGLFRDRAGLERLETHDSLRTEPLEASDHGACEEREKGNHGAIMSGADLPYIRFRTFPASQSCLLYLLRIP